MSITCKATEYDPEKRIWSGPKSMQDIFHPNSSIGQIIYQRIRVNPKNVLQINDSERITFTNEQVLSMSVKVALGLLDLNLKQTDFIGIMASNTSYLMPLCFGCFFAAIPFHTMEVSLDKEMVSHSWNKIRPKAIFCEASAYNVVNSVICELELNASIFIVKDHIEGVNHIEDMFERNTIPKTYLPSEIRDGNETALILSSSGSTGMPKAVTISHNWFKVSTAMA